MSDSSPLAFQSRGLAATYLLLSKLPQREVCLKHRKNRREISCGCALSLVEGGSGVCSFCRYSGAGAHSRSPRRSFAVIVQEPRCLSAIQAMPVQVRLTAPIFRYPQSNHTTCAAGVSLRSSVSKTLRARGSTGTPCHFSSARRNESARICLHEGNRGADAR